jgi:Mg2+ and Co2+ transporter CorA
MNVSLPVQRHADAFAVVLVVSLALCVAVGTYFRRRGWL